MNELILRNLSEDTKKNMTSLQHTSMELTSGVVAGIAAATLSQVAPLSRNTLSHMSSLRIHFCHRLIREKVEMAGLYHGYTLWVKLQDFEDYLPD